MTQELEQAATLYLFNEAIINIISHNYKLSEVIKQNQKLISRNIYRLEQIEKDMNKRRYNIITI